MPVSLTNSNDIIANSAWFSNDNDVINVFDLVRKNNETIEKILGLPPETLNTLHKIADNIHNNGTFVYKKAIAQQ